MRRSVTVLVGWLLLAGSGGAAPPLAKFEPPTGCYLGAFIEHDDYSHGDIATFERAAGQHAAYITYTGYGRPFPDEWVRQVGATGAAAHLGWEPNDGLAVIQDDAYLRGWARRAAATGVPIFLRFASEMNGNWMPYSGDPALYIAKWRLVAEVMRAEAPNVALVWCVFTTPQRTIPLYYPGDDWVDWVGVNIYSVVYHNRDRAQPAAWKDPRQELTYVYDRYSGRKPIMICEYAASSWCAVVGGPTVDFALEKMTTLYRSLPTQFPRVKGVQWFCVDTIGRGQADNNYSLTLEPRLTQRYRELTAGDWFRKRIIGWRGLPPRPKLTVGLADQWPEPRAVVIAADPRDTSWHAPARVEDQGPSEAERSPFGLAGLRAGQQLSGVVELTAYLPADWRVTFVSFRCNDRSIGATNRQPYRTQWDTRALEPGRYELTVRISRRDGETVTSPPLAVEVRRAL